MIAKNEENFIEIIELLAVKIENNDTELQDIKVDNILPSQTFETIDPDAATMLNDNNTMKTQQKSMVKMKNNLIGKIFHCDICKAKFKYKQNLKKHFEKPHHQQTNKRYQCPDCAKCFSGPKMLRRHSVIHGDDYRKCKLCSKEFFSRTNLLRHIDEIHKQKKLFECDYCHNTFAQMVALKLHINANHVRDIMYKCTICDKQLLSRDGFYKHQKYIHFDANVSPRPKRPPSKGRTGVWQCQYCGKMSKQRNTHETHLRTHTGERPYPCQICDKKFAQHSSLLQHSRVHTGETPFKCEICEKKFKFKIRLQEHSRLHTGDRPYACTYCDKTFTMRGNLTVHMRSLHTGETPYECKQCDNKFTTVNALKRHLNSVHTITI